jgi:hypothetical protein
MSSRSPLRAAAASALLISLLATACSGGAGASSAPSTSGGASPSAGGSLPPTPDATPPASSEMPTTAPTLQPTPDIGPFSCTFPVEGSGTAARGHLADVRVGTHDGYDRIVFEFTDAIPPYSIDVATPPFSQDPSGLPMTVDGSYFWQVVLNGGTKMLPDGTSSYDGATDFTPGYPKLAELVESGDFEAVSTWYIGMSGESCVRVLTLDGPPRLVVDIEH